MKNLLCVLSIIGLTAGSPPPLSGVAGPGGVSLPDSIKTESVAIGTSFRIFSKVCGENRTIMVGLPAGYEGSTKRYPVFYVIDGQWNFRLATENVGILSDNGFIPPMIVVAIHTGNKRDIDLLPTRNEESRQGGGADLLLRFIKEELIPFVDGRYRTSPYRVITGASYGGVFVMHAFLSDPLLFTAFLAQSPSMWWDYRVMLKRTEAFLLKNPDLSNYLYLSVTNEGTGMGVGALAEILKREAPKRLIWRFDEYPEEIHGTVSYKGMYNGLKFVFSDWLASTVQFDARGDLLSPKDTVKVKLNGYGNCVRYTLDGSEPDSRSALYQKPLTVTKPVTIKAVAYYGLSIPGISDSLAIRILPKLLAETGPPVLAGGLDYAYYEGDWDVLPNVDSLAPVKTGIAGTFEMAERKRDIQFAMGYSGYLDIPKDAVYRFFLSSDDGSQLTIGDQRVVLNDGLHDVVEKTGKAFLTMGKHRVGVLFFQKSGGFQLNLEYESPDIPRQKIPVSAFFHPADNSK